MRSRRSWKEGKGLKGVNRTEDVQDEFETFGCSYSQWLEEEFGIKRDDGHWSEIEDDGYARFMREECGIEIHS